MADRKIVMGTNLTNECFLAAEPRFYGWFREDDPLAELRSGFPAPLAKPRSGFLSGSHALAFLEGDPMSDRKIVMGTTLTIECSLAAEPRFYVWFREDDPLAELLSGSHALAFLFLEGDPMSDRKIVMGTNLTNECSLAAEPRIYVWFREDDPLAELRSGFSAPLAKPRSGFLSGSHALAFLFLEGDPMSDRKIVMGTNLTNECSLAAEPRFYVWFREDDPLAELRSGFPAPLAKPRSGFLSGSHALAILFLEGDPMSEFLSGFHALLAKPHSGFLEGDSLAKVLLAIPHGRFYAIRSNQGESLGSGGRAGEERNGGGGDGNQGIGGGVGGGGQREGIGNVWRGNRGRNHGGSNGDDDGNDRGGWDGYIEGERRPMGPRPDRMAEILLLLDAEIIGTLESLDIHGLSARARILRVFSLGFASVALICLSASIGQRRTNPILASVLSWIGSAATFLGFFLMIAMAFSASFN